MILAFCVWLFYGAVWLPSVSSTLLSCGVKETTKVADIPGTTLLPVSFGPTTWKYSESCSSSLTCRETLTKKNGRKNHTQLHTPQSNKHRATQAHKWWFIHCNLILSCTTCRDKCPSIPHDLFQSFCSPYRPIQISDTHTHTNSHIHMWCKTAFCCFISHLVLTVMLAQEPCC